LSNPWVGFELLSETQPYGQATYVESESFKKNNLKKNHLREDHSRKRAREKYLIREAETEF
jgi:hypothetical protein